MNIDETIDQIRWRERVAESLERIAKALEKIVEMEANA
jgi:hypothetical protein